MTDPQIAHFPDTLARLQQQFPAAVTGSQPTVIDPWIEITADSLVAVCTWLRDTPDLSFEMLADLTAVDYVQTEKKAQKITFQPHLEVVYHLVSLTHKRRLVLKVLLSRWKGDVTGQLPEVPSVASVWKTADWHEREAFDLFGIQFVGHPDLRRILCPEDWVGYPLRKDYVMPVEYHGIRAK